MVLHSPCTSKDIAYKKKRGTDIPRLLMEVVRKTFAGRCNYNSPRITREPLYSLACENFSRFHQQGEHNDSCFYKSAA